MNSEKRARLEAAGYVLQDAEDFLELTAEQRALVELRITLIRAVREERQKQNLSQQQLAKRIGSSQSRIAKLEAGSPSVSFDLLIKIWHALGGRVKLMP